MAQQSGNNFREDFDGAALDASSWSQALSAGALITAAVASQVLTINMGTQANDTYTLTSLVPFSLPGRVKFTCSVSQRIANQSLTLRVRNAAGDTIAAWIIDGTTNTTAKISSTRKGVQATADASLTIQPASSALMVDYEIDCRVEAVDFGTRTADAATAATNNGSRTRTIPTADGGYVIEIVAANGAIAPASNTVIVVESIFYQDTSRAQLVEIAGGRGGGTPARSVPVNVVGMPAIATVSAGINRMGFIGTAGFWYDDSTTALAAGATFTGSSRDLAGVATATTFATNAAMPQEYRTSAESDQSFTLALEVSRDNSTWRRVKAVASAAVTGGGQYAEIVHRPSWRYARTVVVNGATLQARLAVETFSLAD